ncbi:hypothetical protein FSP39_019795 [Pinctada imbricata]|uniref:JmjC domain-containing protein n=1 Tax=Pinctada imbricata TaxID=66713 RepID=A0AA89C1S7_PINIB|nr:hypothetical protein FSP39_019795 [Pinctada imbricata]
MFIWLICLLNPALAGDPPGHLKPLGQHRPPLGGVDEIEDFPLPWDFYENYVKDGGKPFILRGYLNRGEVPAYKLWNDQYLKEKFGSEKVDVEQGKKEDRLKGKLDVVTLRDYLNSYNDSDIYLVHDAPDVMKADLTIPVSLQCGGFHDNLFKVVLWFSSGGTKSHLHHDGLDNINCLLDGEKDFYMVDKAHEDLIEADGFLEQQSYSTVDVEAVDMYKFPKLGEVPWYEIHMKKGDCLYIPYKWYHQVDSKPGRNFAVNIWFYHIWRFNHTDCQTMKSSDQVMKPKLLSSYKKSNSRMLMWQEILGALSELKGPIQFDHLEEALFGGDNEEPESKQITQMLFEVIDKDKDHEVSWEEAYTVDLEELAEIIPDILGDPMEPQEDDIVGDPIDPSMDEQGPPRGDNVHTEL